MGVALWIRALVVGVAAAAAVPPVDVVQEESDSFTEEHDAHIEPKTVGWGLLRFLIALHLLPLMYWLYCMFVQWRNPSANSSAPMSLQKMREERLRNSRNIKQLKQLL
ncbi:hypothetical protein BJ742DRAFT_797895 [Cladochytrium replicatum]|nr:hypothetical protein BJ742DRAFT_797895 [Cladochytrium replicatum]